MIEITDLHKSFGKNNVLKGINLKLNTGTCVALSGPNASGKTTLIKIILGIVLSDRGLVKVDKYITGNSYQHRQLIGYMPQIARYPSNMTVGQLINLIKTIRNHGESSDIELLEIFRIRDIYKSTLNSLSGGTRQKVSAALAFMFNTPILILDEPTAGLDPVSAEILKEKIRKELIKNKLIIVTSHILSDLEDVSTHVAYLNDGKVVFYDTIQTLVSETGCERLSQAIIFMMQQNN